MKQITFTVLMYFVIRRIEGLRLTEMEVPQTVDINEAATLLCSYDMGNHALNSVKWYKDDSEFFRYTPMMFPSVMKFNTSGITLADQQFNCNKRTCSITLTNFNKDSSGAYRCEVSGDAPEFKIISNTKNMTIAALPQHNPTIWISQQKYRIGDIVMANCTSDKSNPPADLFWYIDGELAIADSRPPQDTLISSINFPLYSRTSELDIIIDKLRFSGRTHIDFKCIAKIKNFPDATRETVGTIEIEPYALNNERLVKNWRMSQGNCNLPSILYTILHCIVFFLGLHLHNNLLS